MRSFLSKGFLVWVVGAVSLFAISTLWAAAKPPQISQPKSAIESKPNTTTYSEQIGISLFPHYPTPHIGPHDNADLIKRGEYLAKIGNCISCHTNTKAGGKPFAGGLPIETPFGIIYSSNITADQDTGIGTWTDKQFNKAMREGVSPQGQHYFPVFPYVYFNKLTDQDLVAIKAYLFSVPHVKQENKANELPFPFSWRFLQFGWKLLFFDFYKGQFKYEPNKSAEWNRGYYLVEGLGHCAMCHTPINPLGGAIRSRHMTGGFVDGFWAPNITQLGLRSADTDALVKVFSHDQLINAAGRVSGPMAEVNHNSLQYLTDTDLRAIAVYLQSIESKEVDYAQALIAKKDTVKGRIVFQEKCSMCHSQGSEVTAGAPSIGNVASWSARLKQGLPTLYQHTINGYNAMPVRGNCVTCADSDIVAAVDYIITHTLTSEQRKQALFARPKRLTPEDGKKVYEKACAVCHTTGRDGAPKLGDKTEWQSRLKKNVDVLMTHSVYGINGSHIRGNCEVCSKEEVMAAVKYMLQESTDDGNYSLW